MRKNAMKRNAAVVNHMSMTVVVATTIEASIMKSLPALMHKMWRDTAMKTSMMPLMATLKRIGISTEI